MGRALLIGSAVGGLTGVSHDVAAMAAWLEGRGFACDTREGSSATRAGILDGLARLARDARRGEPAVFYYSGHGGHVAVPTAARFVDGRVAPRAFHYLVPTDHDKHRAFRGIFRAELSLAMRALSERTSNITVILDACHSTDAVRDDDMVLKAVVEPWTEGIEAHVAWLQEQGYELERLPELRNASMVLLSACTATRQAFEHTRPVDGMRCGLFTDCLLDALSRIPDPSQVTWDALVRRVADRVRRIQLHQRPQVSGPSARFLLSEREQRRLGALTLQDRAGGWFLEGGSAAGVMQGDHYRVLDALAEDDPPPLAEVVVSEVEAHVATVTVVSGTPERLGPGLLALPHPGGPPHQRCRVEGSGALADELHERLGDIEGLELLDAGDRAEVAFVLAVHDTEAHVLDANGSRLRWPWRDAPELAAAVRRERIDGLLEDLRRIVRGTDLLALARRGSDVPLPPSLRHRLEWGRVEDGTPQPLPPHGAELSVGDRFYISLDNEAVRPVHVSIFDVGVGRAVTLLNRNEPAGIDLGVRERELLGAPELGPLLGFELQWPDETPPDGPREESLVLVLSTRPLPLTSWETSPGTNWSVHRDVGAILERPRGPDYAIRHLSFRLHPRTRPYGQRISSIDGSLGNA